MTFPITTTFAVVFTLMFIALATMVSMRRGETGISILWGDDDALAIRVRRHGNFAEVIPFALILMGLAEAYGANPLWLWAMGISVFIGRIAHTFGLNTQNVMHPLRIGAGAATQIPMLVAVGYLIWVIYF